jgi:glycosyltransferase involved in cell wall biosynthesis
VALGRDPEQTVALRWGPQLDYSHYHSHGERFVVSTGKSHRDLATLTTAAVAVGVPTLVYAPPDRDIPTQPGLTVRRFDSVLTPPTVLDDLAQASVVAIPMETVDRMVGLTELNDALGLGKPIVMTRSPHIDVDVEKIGCGFAVELGDVNGWRVALSRLNEDSELRRVMGERARTFAEREWNANICNEQIRRGLENLLSN